MLFDGPKAICSLDQQNAPLAISAVQNLCRLLRHS
jgi:hypothetical protein